MSKIEKSKKLGKEFEYVPSVWWFQEMQFIKNYIKKRNSLDYSAKPTRSKRLKKTDSDGEDEIDEEYFELEEVFGLQIIY